MRKILLGVCILALTNVAYGGTAPNPPKSPATHPGGAPVLAPINIQTGLYEITLTTETPMPGNSLDQQVIKQCVKKADLEDPQKFVQQQPSQDMDCTMVEIASTGDHLSFTQSCPKEEVTATGEYTFASNAYHGAMTMTMAHPGGRTSLTMTTKTDAKLTGPCP